MEEGAVHAFLNAEEAFYKEGLRSVQAIMGPKTDQHLPVVQEFTGWVVGVTSCDSRLPGTH